MAMASLSYECNVVSQLVQPLHFNHQPWYIPPVLTQINVTIEIDLRRRDPLTGHYTTHSPLQETLCFGLDVLLSRNLIHEEVGPAFTRLGINSSSTDYNIVEEIVRRGFIIADMKVHRGSYCEVMYLHTVIQALVVENEVDQESRVAAKESWIKEMLRMVRVKEAGDEDKCAICLELLMVGFEASQMPCPHIFHHACIQTWLKRSHSCPLCRFQMPTN
ncbi:hypothetical protein F3Y22_tig00116954pilonHSYRG00269 [Hibiscus syriacus]|uniref:RING-type E3 ubiquitin transferase n=1 Tax=Hibiscus syriacus TaxID=106335 RepID=A0A6A2WXW6_HIBSY|nr:hypothetical protein F3Y22_tig00116954pilonHSYRG00269 [Hibiscus syriacus]